MKKKDKYFTDWSMKPVPKLEKQNDYTNRKSCKKGLKKTTEDFEFSKEILIVWVVTSISLSLQ